MNTYYITADQGTDRATFTFHGWPTPVPHYVVKATTEAEAILLTKAYHDGTHWAVEQALAGDIRIEIPQL